MGQINIWIKGAFIIVCFFIGTISTLSLAITLFGHGYAHKTDEIEVLLPAISVVYVVGTGSLALTIIGAYGACKKKKWAAFLFSLGMTVASLYMLASFIYGCRKTKESKKEFRKHFQTLMSRTNLSEKDLEMINTIQHNFKCCGVEHGYKDWGDEIPISCFCSADNIAFKCVDPGKNAHIFFHHSSNDSSEEDHFLERQKIEHMLVYPEPCIPVLMNNFNFIINLTLGISFAMTSLWAVGSALAITILCQMRSTVNVPPVMFTSKVSQYTQLSETVVNA